MPPIFQILQERGRVARTRCIRSSTWASAWSRSSRLTMPRRWPGNCARKSSGGSSAAGAASGDHLSRNRRTCRSALDFIVRSAKESAVLLMGRGVGLRPHSRSISLPVLPTNNFLGTNFMRKNSTRTSSALTSNSTVARDTINCAKTPVSSRTSRIAALLALLAGLTASFGQNPFVPPPFRPNEQILDSILRFPVDHAPGRGSGVQGRRAPMRDSRRFTRFCPAAHAAAARA